MILKQIYQNQKTSQNNSLRSSKELEKIAEKARLALGDKLTNRVGAESYETLCGSKPPAIEFSHFGLESSIELENKPHNKYSGENISALINGIGGSINYRDPSWQGLKERSHSNYRSW